MFENIKSIGLINCYFGKLPWYFDYFIQSCSYNPSVDFFILTDDETGGRLLPGNVKVIPFTLEKISLLAVEKLGIPVKIKYGYKLCDFKPAYGLIFSDLLKDYDYWGHTDLDLIFGDIRAFITPDLLNNFDVISVRPDWLTGCFLLYRNVPHINSLFRESRDYRLVFTSDKHYCFDETAFAHDQFSAGKPYQEIITEIESMMHVMMRLINEARITVHFDLFIIEGLPGRLSWDNGKMTYRNEFEVLFYHMIYFKKKFTPKAHEKMIHGKFKISPTRIYKIK